MECLVAEEASTKLKSLQDDITSKAFKRWAGRCFSTRRTVGFKRQIRTNVGNNVGATTCANIMGVDAAGGSINFWEHRRAGALVAAARLYFACINNLSPYVGSSDFFVIGAVWMEVHPMRLGWVGIVGRSRWASLADTPDTPRAIQPEQASVFNGAFGFAMFVVRGSVF